MKREISKNILYYAITRVDASVYDVEYWKSARASGRKPLKSICHIPKGTQVIVVRCDDLKTDHYFVTVIIPEFGLVIINEAWLIRIDDEIDDV